MKESEHQARFLQHFADLIHHINATPGYTCTAGDLYRDPRVHGKWGEKGSYSASKSYHKRRMAGDLNLFYEGEYCTGPEHWQQFADYWEALDPLNRSGIRFNDANHNERVPEGWR